MDMQIPLPAGWGEAWLHELGAHRQRSGATARSYDHAGRQLVWSPVAAVSDRRIADDARLRRRSEAAVTDRIRFACDIEDGSRLCADMAAQFGVTEPEFRRRWVATEVLAKLHDVPILAWLKERGLSEEDGNNARILVREWPATGGVMAFGMLDTRGEITI